MKNNNACGSPLTTSSLDFTGREDNSHLEVELLLSRRQALRLSHNAMGEMMSLKFINGQTKMPRF